MAYGNAQHKKKNVQPLPKDTIQTRRSNSRSYDPFLEMNYSSKRGTPQCRKNTALANTTNEQNYRREKNNKKTTTQVPSAASTPAMTTATQSNALHADITPATPKAKARPRQYNAWRTARHRNNEIDGLTKTESRLADSTTTIRARLLIFVKLLP